MIKKIFSFIWDLGMMIPVILIAFIFFGFIIGGGKGLVIAGVNIAGLLYIFSPIDFSTLWGAPDFVPIIGWIDDLIVAFILFFIDMWALGMILAQVVKMLPLAIVIAVFVALAKYLGKKKNGKSK